MERKSAVLCKELSVFSSVLSTLRHISACLSPAKNFNSPSVCLLPLLSCWKKKKNTAMISPPDWHSRELSSRKQPPSPKVRESDRVAVYWWQLCNYVIKSEKRNFVTSQDAWWVRIPITTHYYSIHMIISSRQAKSLCVRRANIWIKTALAMMILWRALLWLSKKTWGPKRWLGHFRIHFHLSYHIPSNGDVSL